MSEAQIAQQNLRYILWQYVFSKRVFAPIIAIYLSDYAGLSLTTIGTVLAIATIAGLLLELPTGVFADKFGRAKSIKIGSPLGVLSIIAIVLMPNIAGAFLWQILDAAAFAFWGGARESLVHDSLEVLKKGDTYKKFMTDMQRKSLLVSALLLSVVPLSYNIDKRLPLVIGGFGYVLQFFISLKLHNIKSAHESEVDPFSFIRLGKNIRYIGLLIIAMGVLNAISSHGTTPTLGLKAVGLSPVWISWIFAASGFLAFFANRLLQHIMNLKMKNYIIFDLMSAVSVQAAILAGSAQVAFLIAVANMTWWRFRPIYYSDHLFKGTTKNYKASMISAVNLSTSLFAAAVNFGLGVSADKSGILFANMNMILIVVAISPLVWYAFLKKKYDF